MRRTSIFLAIACINLIMSPQFTSAGIAASVSKLLECCPTMPILVNKASVNACMPAIERRSGFHMFGGSVEKTRNCVLECAFQVENLLMPMENGSLTVNLTAVEAKLGMNTTNKWQNVLSGVKMNCTARAPIPTKRSVNQRCTSGALELSLCVYKYMMTVCPEKIETIDCLRRISDFPLSQIEKFNRAFKKKKTTTAATDTTENTTTAPNTTTAANATETTTTVSKTTNTTASGNTTGYIVKM